MLELLNVYKHFGTNAALTDVSLAVEEGDTHALIGSSGSGKTTLLRIMLGLTAFDRGYVKINHQKLLSLSPRDWSEMIGYVPQEGGLFPHLSALRNITLIASARGWPRVRQRKRLEELASLVDLDIQMLGRFPQELSGGQRQRVAIMRAAFLNPSILLLDEPMGALDPLIRHSLQDELKSIFLRLKKTVVIVTHDLSEAVFLAGRMTLLHQGRVIQTGTYQDFTRRPADPFVSFFIQSQRLLPPIEAVR